jgi:3-dehydroquinate synthase
MAVDLSYRLGWIDDSLVKRVRNILKLANLPTEPPETMTVEMFKSVMAVKADAQCPFNVQFVFNRTNSSFILVILVDKKVADGLLRLILLKGPLGSCVFTGDYDRKALDDTLRAFCKS